MGTGGHSEEPWGLAQGWAWTLTGAVCKVVSGGTPSTKEHKNYEGGDIPWITPADLSGYTSVLIASGKRSITQRGLEASSATLMPRGSVLFSSRAPIGYVAIADTELCTNQGFKSFVPPPEIQSRYLYWYLKRAKSLALERASGTTFLEISGKAAATLPFPLAPLPEQHRIVEAIEAHFSRLDAAVAALKRVQANLKRYRASVLKAACEGRLVPTEAELARKEGRDYEPASKLLERILHERRKRWEEQEWAKHVEKAKQKLAKQCLKNNGEYPPPHILEQDAKYGAYLPKGDKWKAKYKEPARLRGVAGTPEGWTVSILEGVAAVIDPNPSHRMPKYVEKGIPFVSSENFTDGDQIDFSIGKKVTDKTLSEQRDRFVLRAHDFVLSRIGTIGKTRFVPLPQDYCLSHALVVIQTFDGSLDAKFLRTVVSSDALVGQAKDGVQSVGVPDLGMAKIRAFTIPLPPLAEQLRIVAEVERRLSVVDELEAAVAANLKRAERLRQAILKRAFEGRLVPTEHELAQAEGRSYETAEQLLARIKATREAKSGEKNDPAKRPTRKKPAAKKIKAKATLFRGDS